MSKRNYYITINMFGDEDDKITRDAPEDKNGLTVYRRTKINTNDFAIGDQIAINHYTATCQRVDENGALFFMDQYDDDPQRMNDEDTNEGGYKKSDLRRRINNEKSLKDFPEDIRARMVPFENGDLIRIPTVEEIFGKKECNHSDDRPWCEKIDNRSMLPLMTDKKNCIAFRKNSYEWGWLQNKIPDSAANFAHVNPAGYASYDSASSVYGVRRAFLIK